MGEGGYKQAAEGDGWCGQGWLALYLQHQPGSCRVPSHLFPAKNLLVPMHASYLWNAGHVLHTRPARKRRDAARLPSTTPEALSSTAGDPSPSTPSASSTRHSSPSSLQLRVASASAAVRRPTTASGPGPAPPASSTARTCRFWGRLAPVSASLPAPASAASSQEVTAPQQEKKPSP